MKTVPACALLVPLLAGALAAEPARLTPGQAAPLRTERQVAVVIRQVYSWQQEEDGKEKDGKTAEPGAEKKPRDLLPLAAETAKALEFAGWRSAPAGASTKVRLEFEIYGNSAGGEYTGTVSGYQHSGAEVNGHVTIVSEGVEIIRESVSAKIEPPYSINRYYLNPWDAPFGLLTRDCLAAVYVALGAVHGPGPLLAAVDSDNGLHRESAALALCRQAEPDLQPALLNLLRRDDEERRAIAAALLGIVGDERALVPLLETLRATAGEGPAGSEYNDYEWEELLKFERDPIERAARRHDAPSLIRGPAADAALWALLQNPAPDKALRLAVALGDGTMPPRARRALALVLGRLDDKAAAPALIAATRDRSPLVQAAALVALKSYHFQESDGAAAAVLALTTSAHLRVRTLAREVAGEYSAARGRQYVIAKYGKDARPSPARVCRELLAHSDPLVRLDGAKLAADAGPKELATAVQLLRSDAAPVVREGVVKLLAENRRDEHTEDFIFALADKDEATRLRALQALKDGDNPGATGETEEGKEAKPSPLPESALAPLLALAGTAPEAFELLERVQGEGVNNALLATAGNKSAGAPTREAAIIELARRGDGRASALLAGFLAAGEPVARPLELRDAAGKLDDEALVDPLLKILRQGPEPSQVVAAEILGVMSHTRAVGPMIVALRQAHDRSRHDLADRLRFGLQSLTGQDLSTLEEWLVWWKQSASRMPARRARGGS